jgi:hypothetical protein
MKTLSLLQPWASLVVMGVKKIETRSWSTAYRGDLLIHASMGKSGGIFSEEPPFTKYIPDFRQLPFGYIIGKVILEDVCPMEALFLSGGKINELTFEERAFGDYGSGRFAWLLSNPVQFTNPVRTRGHLHLWEYHGEEFT